MDLFLLYLIIISIPVCFLTITVAAIVAIVYIIKGGNENDNKKN